MRAAPWARSTSSMLKKFSPASWSPNSVSCSGRRSHSERMANSGAESTNSSTVAQKAYLAAWICSAVASSLRALRSNSPR
ncbi:hypothetical protein D3C72_944410 [compost metagenome]